MSSNREIVFTKHCEVDVADCEMPVLQKNEVLIKTGISLISTGTELTILGGKDIPAGSAWDQFGKMPFKPGYNNIGVVVDVADGADKHWMGKRVATYGSHAKYISSNVENLREVPPGIKDEHAVFFTIAEISMNGVRRGNIKWGEIIVIYGLGLLGQLAARFCRMCGAKTVIAVDVSDYRLGLLPCDTHIIPVNSEKVDVAGLVKDISGGHMADVVYEVTGVASIIPDEFKVLRSQGRFVVLSSPRGKTLFDFHDLCNAPSYTIIGAHNFSHPKFETPENPWTMKRDSEFFFHMISDGDIDIEPLISHKVHYSNAASMYNELLRDRAKAMGVLLEWN